MRISTICNSKIIMAYLFGIEMPTSAEAAVGQISLLVYVESMLAGLKAGDQDINVHRLTVLLREGHVSVAVMRPLKNSNRFELRLFKCFVITCTIFATMLNLPPPVDVQCRQQRQRTTQQLNRSLLGRLNNFTPRQFAIN